VRFPSPRKDIEPPSISGLSAWWDFGDAETTSIDGFGYTAVTDKSGNSHDLSQLTDNKKPPKVTAANRNATLTPNFNNTMAMNVSGSMNVRTLVMACSHTRTVGWFFESPFGTPSNDAPFVTSGSWPNYSGSFITGGGGGRWFTNGVESGAIVGGGVLQTAVIERHSNVSRSNWNTHMNNSGGSWGGIICEMMVFDRVLLDTERNALESYLTNKWSI